MTSNTSEPTAPLSILNAERVAGKLIVTFSSGESYEFSAEALHAARNTARLLQEDEAPGGIPRYGTA